eukprot:CAMPEP_0197029876 /NCGR_PEP_ID=MMETSP1384-20130603/9233_1 /TAXON_ID=29189 /ORGANISM="Ammonia sp." /LENGTH=533 /DNA_ID=CAMNT_0042459119 /DNA_START=105 /DNA_END=1703 /DNA_ORIENTATION=+
MNTARVSWRNHVHFVCAFLLCSREVLGADPVASCLTDGHSLTAWYDASSYTAGSSVWPDDTGNGYDATITGTLNYFDGTDASSEMYLNAEPSVYGTYLDTKISFGDNLSVGGLHTVFFVCKYNGDIKRRIIQSSTNNVAFGAYSGRTGVAYSFNQWITDYNSLSATERYGTDWYLSAQAAGFYRGNGVDYTVAGVDRTRSVAPGVLKINAGQSGGESSDFACAEVMIFNDQLLSEEEVICVENYFATKYALFEVAEVTAPPTSSPSANPTVAVCDEDAVATFNWDELMESGTDKPEVVEFSMSVNESDLSLNILAKLTYEGKSSADVYDAVYGTTYVLDFEDFDAHSDAIYEPGTCQNRNADSFTDKTFDEWWAFSANPDDVGSANYLAYPPASPASGSWQVYMDEDNECTQVVYEGKFTWNELVACSAYGDTTSYVSTTDTDDSITLEGTFYINVVSPYAYNMDLGYYRVYQLLSQPFIITINKNVYVLNYAEINLLTMSIIAVYKEDAESVFKLVVLTEAQEYLQLTRSDQ